jgi:serine/threonine-protein kinase
LPSNPLTKTFHKDDKTHTLRFEAPGHDSEERQVTFDQDSEIVVSLRETPKPVVSAPATPEKKPSSGGAVKPRPVKKPSASCDPPFVVDARGVKRYKPECL